MASDDHSSSVPAKYDRLNPDEKLKLLRERISERIVALGTSARAVSLQAGLGADAIRIIMDGRSRQPGLHRLEAIARVLQCDVRYLLGWRDEVGEPRRDTDQSPPDQLLIAHRLAAGVWRETGLPHEPLGSSAPPPLKNKIESKQWLELVGDDSFDLVIPEGFLVHVRSLPSNYTPMYGDLVIIERVRDGGRLSQRTLRQVVRSRGERVELQFMSHNPQWGPTFFFQASMPNPWPADRFGYFYRPPEERRAADEASMTEARELAKTDPSVAASLDHWEKLKKDDEEAGYTYPELDSQVEIVGLVLQAFKNFTPA